MGWEKNLQKSFLPLLLLLLVGGSKIYDDVGAREKENKAFSGAMSAGLGGNSAFHYFRISKC